MAINKITKLDLESRAIALKGKDMSYSEIAAALSNESNEVITSSSVQRFFASRDKAKAQAIEKSDKLKAKFAEAEISTIEKRLLIIDKFVQISDDAKQANDFKAAIHALQGATEAQDSLDTRLGKLKDRDTCQNVNIFNVQEAMNGAREQLSSRISSIAAKFEEVRDPEQSE